MTHGVRKGIFRGGYCPRGQKSQYTTYRAAWAAVARVPDAIRAYRGSCCGWYHITRYTVDEYAQRAALGYEHAELDSGCTSDVEWRKMDSITTDEEFNHEAQGSDQPRDAGGGHEDRQPKSGAGGPGAAAFVGSPGPRLAPSPATVASCVSQRRG